MHRNNHKYTHILFGNIKGRDHLEDLGIDGSIIFRSILN
jgi:hypothetical protein